MTKTVEESQFAEHATELLKEVTESGDELLITREGKPVAVIGPTAKTRYPTLESFRGSVKIVGDIAAPLDVEWDVTK